MTIKAAHSYLVHPGKNQEEQPDIAGTTIKLNGKLFNMLQEVYEKSDKECNIDIAFSPNSKGEQQNDCRDLVLRYIDQPSKQTGEKLAARLQAVTTRRSKLGLLFTMLGEERSAKKLVLSRFPADSGILADLSAGNLNVEFLERIFMKSKTDYKSAVFVRTSSVSDFWDAKAVDKQIDNQQIALSDYWIKDFLASDFRTTAAAGTRRLANALKTASKNSSSLVVKEQIAAAANLADGFNGRRTSIAEFLGRLRLSDEVRSAIIRELPNERLFTDKFKFDCDEFRKHLTYRSIELDTGAMLTAQAEEFDSLFLRQPLSDERVQYRTEGRVINERLRSKL